MTHYHIIFSSSSLLLFLHYKNLTKLCLQGKIAFQLHYFYSDLILCCASENKEMNIAPLSNNITSFIFLHWTIRQHHLIDSETMRCRHTDTSSNNSATAFLLIYFLLVEQILMSAQTSVYFWHITNCFIVTQGISNHSSSSWWKSTWVGLEKHMTLLTSRCHCIRTSCTSSVEWKWAPSQQHPARTTNRCNTHRQTKRVHMACVYPNQQYAPHRGKWPDRCLQW